MSCQEKKKPVPVCGELRESYITKVERVTVQKRMRWGVRTMLVSTAAESSRKIRAKEYPVELTSVNCVSAQISA